MENVTPLFPNRRSAGMLMADRKAVLGRLIDALGIPDSEHEAFERTL